MRRILVTGGSGGIGRAIVSSLLTEGYQVINLDPVSWDQPHEQYHYVNVDLGDETALVDALASLGDIDGLVLNAVHSADTAFATQPMDDIRRAMEINVIAHLRLTQWFQNRYTGSTGRVIWISSTRAKMSEPSTISYAASKGAIESLTHALATTLAPRITVNAIAPGWIHHQGETPRDIDHAFHLSGRVGRPHDIARTVLFLLDEEAQFINGETITIDGGVTKTMIYPE